MSSKKIAFKSAARFFIVVLCLAFIIVMSPLEVLYARPAAQNIVTQQSHYIIFQRDKSGAVTPIFHRYVNLAKPLTSLSDKQVQSSLEGVSRDGQRFGYTLRDSRNSQVVFQGVSEIPNWVRGEFLKYTPTAAGESNIDGHVIPDENATFVVRAPVLDNTNLSISDRTGQTFATVDPLTINSDPKLDTIADQAVQAASIGALSGGNSANRVDLLVMGDGYTSAESTKFATDYDNLVTNFFGMTPYAEYKDYVNTVSLFTASAQSGADHPPYQSGCSAGSPTCCGDSTAASDPLATGSGTFVNTAFDGTFCYFNIHRLVVVNNSKIYAEASAFPDWDEILVILNDSTYGGSGGAIGVFSTHPAVINVAQHEYGHTFTKLADEYSSAYPGYPACSDINPNLPDCESNVTDQTARASIRWTRWIDGGTSIPTSDPTPTIIGLYQGARYLSSGMYRPGYNCLMRSLGVEFCAVASEAYAVRLYSGGWGVPALGIDNIEPGNESPSNVSTIPLVAPNTAQISASLLGPLGTPLDVRWYVNNVQVSATSSSTTATYTFAPVTAGTYVVRLEVMDVSPIIHPAIRANFKSTRQWTFSVSTLMTPTNNASLTNRLPNFTWVKGTNATSYEIQFDSTNPPTVDPIPVSGTTFTVPNFLPFGVYYWRVRSTINGITSNWSQVRTFTITSAAGSSPTQNYFVGTNVTLTWNSLSGAVAYQVQTNSNTTFTGSFNDLQTVPASQLSTVVTPPQDGAYYWRVRAQKSDGTWGGWSIVNSFTVDVP